MKEAGMMNPNPLGHYHRDIVKVIDTKPYYVKLLLTCNHTTWISAASYKKYKDHATLCCTCSHLGDMYQLKYHGADMKTKLKYHESTGLLEVAVQCPTCEEFEAPLTVLKTEYERWRTGVSPQQAFPTLSASQRELLVYGTCTHCLNELAEQHKINVAEDIEKHMEELGYSLIETGGHCTAFYKKDSSGQIELVTDTGGCSHPATWYEPVIIGLYASQDDWDNGIADCEDYRSLRCFLNREL